MLCLSGFELYSCSVPLIKMLNNINMQNGVSPLLLFSLDLPNLRQGRGA